MKETKRPQSSYLSLKFISGILSLCYGAMLLLLGLIFLVMQFCFHAGKLGGLFFPILIPSIPLLVAGVRAVSSGKNWTMWLVGANALLLLTIFIATAGHMMALLEPSLNPLGLVLVIIPLTTAALAVGAASL